MPVGYCVSCPVIKLHHSRRNTCDLCCVISVVVYVLLWWLCVGWNALQLQIIYIWGAVEMTVLYIDLKRNFCVWNRVWFFDLTAGLSVCSCNVCMECVGCGHMSVDVCRVYSRSTWVPWSISYLSYSVSCFTCWREHRQRMLPWMQSGMYLSLTYYFLLLS